MKELKDVTKADTKIFLPNIKFCKCIKVYDGDTITVAADLNGEWYRFSVRIKNLDTPEIRTTNAEEKEIAIIARDTLRELILGEIVELKNISREKYGRLLADVVSGDINCAEWLIGKKLGVEYDGGRKTTPASWRQYHSNNHSNL